MQFKAFKVSTEIPKISKHIQLRECVCVCVCGVAWVKKTNIIIWNLTYKHQTNSNCSQNLNFLTYKHHTCHIGVLGGLTKNKKECRCAHEIIWRKVSMFKKQICKHIMYIFRGSIMCHVPLPVIYLVTCELHFWILGKDFELMLDLSIDQHYY